MKEETKKTIKTFFIFLFWCFIMFLLIASVIKCDKINDIERECHDKCNTGELEEETLTCMTYDSCIKECRGNEDNDGTRGT